MEITWLGTASVKLKTSAITLLIDPFVQCRGGENRNSVGDFLDADAILITHGHLDHLASLPKILKRCSTAVYCTDCAAEHLKGRGKVVRIAPGDNLTVGDVRVEVYAGKHIEFDRKLVRETLSPRNMLRAPLNVAPLFFKNLRYQEKGETVFYQLTVDGLRIQDMGSLALRENVDYPTGADVLLLPYQGSTFLEDAAEGVLGRLKPKKVIATHFDNAFPPVSKAVDTSGLVRMIAEKFPEIELVIPKYGQAIEF